MFGVCSQNNVLKKNVFGKNLNLHLDKKKRKSRMSTEMGAGAKSIELSIPIAK